MGRLKKIRNYHSYRWEQKKRDEKFELFEKLKLEYKVIVENTLKFTS